MLASVTPSQLEEMARVHIFYEVQNLALSLFPIRLAEPGSHVVLTPRIAVDMTRWMEQNRLESTLVHLRCLHSFLTSTLPPTYPTDVCAAHYFVGPWTPPGVVLGASKSQQARILVNINQRLAHITTGRLRAGFTWAEATKHIPTVLTAFRRFVADLAVDGGSRELWFAELFPILDAAGVPQP